MKRMHSFKVLNSRLDYIKLQLFSVCTTFGWVTESQFIDLSHMFMLPLLQNKQKHQVVSNSPNRGLAETALLQLCAHLDGDAP